MSMQTDPIEENILRRIPFEIIILAAFFGLLAIFLFDLLTGLFVLLGGALVSLSFLWLKKSLTRVLLRETGKAVRSGILLYAIRLILIIGIFLIICLILFLKFLKNTLNVI